MAQKTREEIMAEMDAAAEKADEEFTALCEVIAEPIAQISDWMRKYRPSAGFKRLGKIILGENWRKDKGGE